MSIEVVITDTIQKQLGVLMFENIRLGAIADDQQKTINKLNAELKEIKEKLE